MSQQNRKAAPLFWMIVLALAVPTIPFLLLGWWLEPAIESLATSTAAMQPWQSASVVIFGLAIDIFLPVPSSVLLTFAGQSLGAWQGTLVGWVGLNLSAAIGLWASRKFGPWVIERFSSTGAVEDVQQLNQWSVWWTLIACRPLPDHRRRLQLVGGVLSEKRLVCLCRYRFDGPASYVHWPKTSLEKIAGETVVKLHAVLTKLEVHSFIAGACKVLTTSAKTK